MSFTWDEPKIVEVYDPATRQVRRDKATPSYIIRNPYGFRQEDIVHSLSIAVSELVDIAQAQAGNASKLLKEIQNAQKNEEEEHQEEGKGDFNGEDTTEHPLKVKDNGKARGGIDESPNI